jgi:signal transduction histidine kinase
MSRLIGDLLDYSRTRLGQGLPVVRRPAQLDAICRDAIEELRTIHPERTIEYRPEGDGEGEWDAGRVSQVLMNLLTNAARYSPPEASIRLSWRGGEEKVIAVHNDGPPIDPALLGRMFEPFKRGAHAGHESSSSSSRGLGLGLYIVREIVRAHGGSVGVRSEQGAGTTFTVVLPARPG